MCECIFTYVHVEGGVYVCIYVCMWVHMYVCVHVETRGQRQVFLIWLEWLTSKLQIPVSFLPGTGIRNVCPILDFFTWVLLVRTQVLMLTQQHVSKWTIFHLPFYYALDRTTRYNPGRLRICKPPACASRVPGLQYRSPIYTIYDFEGWEPKLFPSFQGSSFLPCTAFHFERVCLHGTMWRFAMGTWTIGYPARQLTCVKFMRAELESDLEGRAWAV